MTEINEKLEFKLHELKVLYQNFRDNIKRIEDEQKAEFQKILALAEEIELMRTKQNINK